MGGGMVALSFHVSIQTKMSSAPMQRIKKRPSSSKVAIRDCPQNTQASIASGMEKKISKRPARVSNCKGYACVWRGSQRL